jgi:FAD synthase
LKNFATSSADTSPMKVTAIVDLQIEIQGLNIEITCRVLKNLAFDLILGTDFLKQTQACIDIQTARLILQKYGVTVPLVEAKSHSQGKAASNSRIKQAKRSTDIAVVQLSLNQ